MKRLIDWIKRDYLLIVLALIFILALLIVLNQQGEYQKICNDHWRNQIRENCKTHRDICNADTIYNKSNLDIWQDFNVSYDMIGGTK